MSLLNADQIAYARALAHKTGLHPAAVGAWLLCEEPATRDPIAQGHNWLNLLHENAWVAHGNRTYSGVPVIGWSPAGFARFASTADAVKEAAVWVNDFSNYAGIRATRGKSAHDQVNAIAASPWDAGHYGNGASIRATLSRVESAHIFGGDVAHPLAWWTVRAGNRVIGRTQHPKLWVASHRVFSKHDSVSFHKD